MVVKKKIKQILNLYTQRLGFSFKDKLNHHCRYDNSYITVSNNTQCLPADHPYFYQLKCIYKLFFLICTLFFFCS